MKKRNNLFIQSILAFCILVMGLVFMGGPKAFAATAVTVRTVDYEEENLIINNNGNSRIYFSTEVEAAKDRWEVLNADFGETTTIDFSWVSPTTQSIIMIKGEENSTPYRIILPERTRKLEISINYTNLDKLRKTATIAPLLNIMTTAGTGQTPIRFDDLEWKKGDGGKWQDIELLTVEQLEKYQIKGTNLYFRIKAVNDITVGPFTPDGSRGRRASTMVKLKINKKATAMVVGIDGNKFLADIKFGKEYRVTTAEGLTEWIQVTDRSVKTIPLSVLAGDGSDGTIADKAFPEMFLEIRDYATAKSAASKITEIYLEEQRTLAGEIIEGEVPEDSISTDEDIYISYNGNKNIAITIPAASPELPYEYCVVKPGEALDFTRVTWSTITKNTAVKVLISKAVDGGTLYVRQKEIKSRAATRTTPAVAYALASTYLSHQINYPAMPQINNATYEFIKGYSDNITFNIRLNTIGKKPYETQIRSIKLGTRDIAFNAVVTPSINPINPNTAYNMQITLTKASLETLTNCFAKPITITFGNGTTDKTSIKLTIQSPTPALALTASAAKGTATGTTAITVVSTVGTGNRLVYTISEGEVKNKMVEDTVTGTAFTSGADITVSANNFITVYEVNSVTNRIVKYRSLRITADIIQ